MQRAWFAFALWPLAALADEGARQQIEQRLRLTAGMLADSATAQRIVASGHARAAGHLDEGKVHHALAVDLAARGDLAGARRAADEALRHLAAARRLVPDAPARQAAARQRVEQLQVSLDRLIEAWRARAGPAPDDDGDLVAATALMATARGFARDGRHDEASHTLELAQGHVLAGMKRVLHAVTLDYTLRASTPGEEFEHDLGRLAGLLSLVPLALRELGPRADAAALVERYVETSHKLRQQAMDRRSGGDLAQAMADLRNALLYVQRALTTAGLVMPQATGGQP
jgi:tetratricopeptide (TPR) repeat protein